MDRIELIPYRQYKHKYPVNYLESCESFKPFAKMIIETLPSVNQLILKSVFITPDSLVFNKFGSLVHEAFEYAIIEKYDRSNRLFFSFNIIKSYINLLKLLKRKIHRLLKMLLAKRIEHGDYLLITDDRCLTNFMHWIIDSLGRLVSYQQKNINLSNIVLTKTCVKQYDYVIKSLKSFGYESKNIFTISSHKWSYFKNLKVVTTTLTAPGNLDGELMRKIRQNLLSYYSDGVFDDKYKKVYLSRNKFKDRHIANENEFVNMIESFGFIVIYPEDYDFIAMINIMKNTKYLIGIHGTALTNMLFMKDQGGLLCLKHIRGYASLPVYWGSQYDSEIADHYFYSMASHLNIPFYHMSCLPDNDSLQMPAANLIVDIEACRKEIKAMNNS